MRQVGSPEGYRAILVAEVDDGIMRVLAHGVTCTQLCPMLDNYLASGRVLVLEVAWIALEKGSGYGG